MGLQGPNLASEREYGYISMVANDKGALIPGHQLETWRSVFCYLGCGPIIQIGQDLSLSPEGKTHAQGDPYGDEQSIHKHAIEVEILSQH